MLAPANIDLHLDMQTSAVREEQVRPSGSGRVRHMNQQAVQNIS
ncbi:hypothetical protein MGAST_15765 [Mycobacterium gastri 'Wayne']|nr:hypothetical protein MGAST_15765 [Mycobacterium gastri 'Wayne']